MIFFVFLGSAGRAEPLNIVFRVVCLLSLLLLCYDCSFWHYLVEVKRKGGSAVFGLWFSSPWAVVQLSLWCGLAVPGLWFSCPWAGDQLSLGCGSAVLGLWLSCLWAVVQLSLGCGSAVLGVWYSCPWGGNGRVTAG